MTSSIQRPLSALSAGTHLAGQRLGGSLWYFSSFFITHLPAVGQNTKDIFCQVSCTRYAQLKEDT